MSYPGSFLIVDPSLRDFVGHHFEYDRSIAMAARERGRTVTVFGHAEIVEDVRAALGAKPVFSRDIWKPYPEELRLSGNVAIKAANEAFSRELIGGLANTPLDRDTVIFGHMITHRQLLGWAEFALEKAGPAGSALVLLLRYQATMYEHPLCEPAFRMLEQFSKKGSIRLVSDSERLAGQLQRLTSLPVATVPIPHTQDIKLDTAQPRNSAARLRVVSLGNARDEKGILEIFQAIRILKAAGLSDRFEFILQVNDPDAATAPAIDFFATELHSNTTLHRQALSSRDYYELLVSADLVVTPYWREIYDARTSGIFLEALAAGKPVLCTRDTWMSDQLQSSGGGLVVENRSSHDMVRQLVKAQLNYPELLEKARSGREAWVSFHNPQSAVAVVLEEKTEERPARISRAAVIYPWGDALDRTAGASVRVNHLAEFLTGHFDEVRMLENGIHGREAKGDISIEAYFFDGFIERDWRMRTLRWVCRVLLGARGGEEIYLLMHVAAHLDGRLRRRIFEMARWANVVFMEYSFLAFAAAPACKAAGVPLILTTYDVLSHLVKHSRPVRWLTQWVEDRALNAVESRVSVSIEDQASFARRGIATRVISHPVDARSVSRSPPFDTRRLLLDICELPAETDHLFFFVGSLYEPNVAAAARVVDIAKAFADRYPRIKARFVIAGGCKEPSDEGIVKSLGKVSDLTLRLLYENARAVVIPLEFGTGASLKTIEALACGKPVLGTSVAFRGIDPQTGEHCVIENDLRIWPSILVNLCDQTALRSKLETGARTFAASYDFRELFKAYFDLFQKSEFRNTRVINALADPAYIGHLRAIVLASFERGYGDLANAGAEEILRLLPDDPGALLAQARLLIAGSSAGLPMIEASISHALASGADALELMQLRSDARRRAGDATRAAEDAKSIVQYAVGELCASSSEIALRDRLWKAFHAGIRIWVGEICEGVLLVRPDLGSGNYHYLLAHCIQDRQNDPDRALRLYQSALDKGFAPYWPHFHRVELFTQMGRLQDARREMALAASAAEDPAQLDQVVRAAEVGLWKSHHAGGHRETVESARQILAWMPNSSAAHYILAESLRELGTRSGKVLGELASAQSLGYAECWIRLSQGHLWRRNGNEVRALKAFAQARAISTSEWLTEYVTDEIEGKLWTLLEGDHGDATIRFARLVLKALPDNPDAQYVLACIGLQRSVFVDGTERARAPRPMRLARAAPLSTADPPIAVLPAELCKRFIDASETERAALRPRLQQGLWDLFNGGDYEKTLELARAAAKADPAFAHAQYLNAECIQILDGSLAEAVACYDAALANGFDRFWSLFNRAQAKRKTGLLDEAVSDLSDAQRAALNADHRRLVQAAARDLEREFEGYVPNTLMQLLPAEAGPR